MDQSAIIKWAIGIVAVILVIWLLKGWIVIYNKFQYWFNRAKRKFADIDIIMQERIDKIHALAQIVKKYDIHEYKALKDVTEARSRWTKDMDFNEKVKLASEMESNFLKIQAIFEKYPQLKADALHLKLMSKDSHVESRLRETRLGYNRIAQQYNERVNIFPRNMVAKVYGFKELNYLEFPGQETFKAKEIFNDQ
ncbi:MAG: LemA family protein [Nitrosarchaeum sp.]|nr:LemA family protein [Nitrosarchaeum sp.]